MGMMNLRSVAFVLITMLLLVQGGQQIKGRVTTGALPVANVKISVMGNEKISSFSGPDGTYTLMGLNPGSYTVSASSPRYWPVSQTDVQTGQMANFQLVEKRYLRNTTGMVVANISMENAQHILDAAENAGDTQAEYLVVNRLLEEQTGNDSLKQRSESLKQVLNSQPTRIGGKVVDARGETLPNVNVKITNQTTGAVFQTKTNDRGQYQLSVFPVGEYKIDAVKNGAQSSIKIHDAVSPNATFIQNLSVSSANQ
jgi:hypothetical protein